MPKPTTLLITANKLTNILSTIIFQLEISIEFFMFYQRIKNLLLTKVQYKKLLDQLIVMCLLIFLNNKSKELGLHTSLSDMKSSFHKISTIQYLNIKY